MLRQQTFTPDVTTFLAFHLKSLARSTSLQAFRKSVWMYVGASVAFTLVEFVRSVKVVEMCTCRESGIAFLL